MVSNVFANVDLLSLIAVFLNGLAVGAILLARMPTARLVGARAQAFLVVGVGVQFYVVVISLRAFAGIPNWERTGGTIFLWLVYGGGVWLGLLLRGRRG